MDGREGINVQGSSSYFLNNRDGFGGTGPFVRGPDGGLQVSHPIYKNLSNHPNISLHPNAGITGNDPVSESSAFRVENSSLNNDISSSNNNNSYTQGMSIAVVPGGSHGGVETTEKKKRGRPRKYGLEGSPKVTLKLSSPVPKMPSSSDPNTSGEKPRKGRPPGTGWKQKLAHHGDWMNSSAGQAFTPHVLHIGVGEDIAAKILAFAQQRSRALCIISGSGSVSLVTLKQPETPSSTVTFEGRFEILCLSGSYLVAGNDGSSNRAGGISISLCSPNGHTLGGAIGGKLIAANNVQVVGCSFVYDATKGKLRPESQTDERKLLEQSSEKPYTPYNAATGQNTNSGPGDWQLSSQRDVESSQEDFDLSRG
ncbi:AT-hook motif nuclear-localized protein 5 [Striga hermonthica]|uniref:AT-hook motif nuclear-localized protein n=1 Tax=Striga hermonthica TaxID=68872 RepID=A0A9N7NV19_STRHE|nr:AT-hook motif nuclear-localized protein 5 [Striga hermonthica]